MKFDYLQVIRYPPEANISLLRTRSEQKLVLLSSKCQPCHCIFVANQCTLVSKFRIVCLILGVAMNLLIDTCRKEHYKIFDGSLTQTFHHSVQWKLKCLLLLKTLCSQTVTRNLVAVIVGTDLKGIIQRKDIDDHETVWLLEWLSFTPIKQIVRLKDKKVAIVIPNQQIPLLETSVGSDAIDSPMLQCTIWVIYVLPLMLSKVRLCERL